MGGGGGSSTTFPARPTSWNAGGLTLDDSHHFGVFGIALGGGADIVSLSPGLADGTTFDFICQAGADPITVDAPLGQVIYIGSSVSSSSGTATSNVTGSRLSLVYNASIDAWYGIASGTWNLA